METQQAAAATTMANPDLDLRIPQSPAPVGDIPMPDSTNTVAGQATNTTLTNPHIPASLIPLFQAIPRTEKEQETFNHRKIEIMRKFNEAQIQALLESETSKVQAILEEDRLNDEKVREEISKLEKQRERERKIYHSLRGGKSKGMNGSGLKKESAVEKVAKEVDMKKDEEEGELVEDGEDVKMEGTG